MKSFPILDVLFLLLVAGWAVAVVRLNTVTPTGLASPSPVIARRVAGEAAWFPATNVPEFFATRQLLIERSLRTATSP